MSFNKYPKNYHSNGYGWHNLAAMGYAKPPSPSKTSSLSSGVSSIHPSPPYGYPSGMPPLPGSQPAYSGMGMPQMPPLPGSNQNVGVQLSYGFAPGITPSHVPNVRRDDSVDAGPGIGWSFGGNNSTNSLHSNDSGVHDTIQSQNEVPCQAVRVPEEDMPIYSLGRWVSGL